MLGKARRWVLAAMGVAAVGAALVACSSSDSKPTGSSGGALESCNNVCQMEGDKMCPNPLMITVALCQQICAAVAMAGSPACQAEIKAQSDCQLAKPDICTSLAACSMTGDAGSACM